MQPASLTIFGTKFDQKTVDENIKTRVEKYIHESKSAYNQVFDSFECDFYDDATIIQLYRDKISPVGLSSLWITNGEAFKPLFPSLEEFKRYGETFGIRLNEKNAIRYGSILAQIIDEVDGFIVREPNNIEEITRAGIKTDTLISVKKIGQNWMFKIYYVCVDSKQIGELDLEIAADGKPSSEELQLVLRAEKATAKFLMK